MPRATIATSALPAHARSCIYLSFADEDRPRAMRLVRWLNDSGWRVVADVRHAFAAPARWSPSPRLDSCDVVLCLITPGWLVSKFCHDEYVHCARQGKFVLPVICELADLGLLPDGMRALPRIDLTQERIDDYLALKDVLRQAGSQIETALTAANESARKRRRTWLTLWMLVAAGAIAAALLSWLWIAR